MLNITFVCAQEMKALDSTDKFVTRLRETSKKTNSIVADFTEEKFSSYLKEPQKSSGVFYYKKANKLRWEKTKPLKYIFISNGDKIKIQENGKEVNVSSAKQVVSKIKELMLTLVNGEFNSGKVFTPSYFQSTQYYHVKLIPKNKKLANLYSYIMLTFTKDTLLLKELAFYEKAGDKNIMTFTNSKTNQEIADTVFTNF
ncbi:MAG: outer membrane lipoprotein carrier protein LolA [Bacteroidia bacterium]|nr:outer membrane lipoprotein carrier protein LolA [Bacteroidia bacterium]